MIHFSSRGNPHNGPEATCALCRRYAVRRELYRKSREGAVDGRTLLRVRPLTYCKCGTQIRFGSKTGLCLACLNSRRAVQKRQRRLALLASVGTCKKCGKQLAYRNTSGLCGLCVRKYFGLLARGKI